ncbi:hypothetical protein ElyMa_001167700 [Elysia marginata]|uniref:Uncharacterized protein n=1 Tax=Elysia marginata TaxID=1093978 RepID=A0AAV4I3F0_9GAST|nr:hypothetical protein ElyMa_001167700 [Elysia marginata]
MAVGLLTSGTASSNLYQVTASLVEQRSPGAHNQVTIRKPKVASQRYYVNLVKCARRLRWLSWRPTCFVAEQQNSKLNQLAPSKEIMKTI